MLDSVSATYPAHREATIVLRDGSTLAVRPIRPDDEADLARFFTELSFESRVFRFFVAIKNADALAKQMDTVDSTTLSGLVAVAGAESRIIGHAMYVTTSLSKAQVAFVVADPYQGRGLGTILLGQLGEAAAAAGI